MVTLFLDSVLKRPEEDIAHFESKGYSGLSSHKKGCYHPYERQQKCSKDTSMEEYQKSSKDTSMEEYQSWTQDRSGQDV